MFLAIATDRNGKLQRIITRWVLSEHAEATHMQFLRITAYTKQLCCVTINALSSLMPQAADFKRSNSQQNFIAQLHQYKESTVL